MTISLKNNQEKKNDKNHKPSQEEAEQAVRTLIRWAGDDPDREGLIDTPARVIRAYQELYSGYKNSEEQIIKTVFTDVAGYNEPVLVRDIPFSSHCEHHMVPFIGTAHIAYLPQNCVIGLSKLARIVDHYARRLQTQEALTAQIGDFIMHSLQPKGLAIFIRAEHMCMSIRGIKKQGSSTITHRYYGVYKDDAILQEQFLQMIHIK